MFSRMREDCGGFFFNLPNDLLENDFPSWFDQVKDPLFMDLELIVVDLSRPSSHALASIPITKLPTSCHSLVLELQSRTQGDAALLSVNSEGSSMISPHLRVRLRFAFSAHATTRDSFRQSANFETPNSSPLSTAERQLRGLPENKRVPVRQCIQQVELLLQHTTLTALLLNLPNIDAALLHSVVSILEKMSAGGEMLRSPHLSTICLKMKLLRRVGDTLDAQIQKNDIFATLHSLFCGMRISGHRVSFSSPFYHVVFEDSDDGKNHSSPPHTAIPSKFDDPERFWMIFSMTAANCIQLYCFSRYMALERRLLLVGEFTFLFFVRHINFLLYFYLLVQSLVRPSSLQFHATLLTTLQMNSNLHSAASWTVPTDRFYWLPCMKLDIAANI